MKRCLVLAISALSMAASPAMASELVVDGGFELAAPAPGGYFQYGSGQTFGGWTVAGSNATNSGLNLSTTYTEAGVAFAARSGLASFDLTAAGNMGPTIGVYQFLTTTVGQAYNVSFWLGNVTGDGTGNTSYYALPSSLTLTIGGGPGQLFENSNITTGNVNWQKFTTSFVAGSTSTKLLFTNSTPTSDNFAGLDDVSVSAVPEPAAWLMMILGFGVIGASLRSRSRKVALA